MLLLVSMHRASATAFVGIVRLPVVDQGYLLLPKTATLVPQGQFGLSLRHPRLLERVQLQRCHSADHRCATQGRVRMVS